MPERSPPTPADQVPEHKDQPSRLQRLLCKQCFEPIEEQKPDGEDRGDNPPVPSSAAPNKDGVTALLAIATEAMKDERERGQNLDTKCASLAGFTGLILSIDGALAGPLFSQKLGSIGQPIAEVSFVIAILFLLMAVLLAVMGVLMPQGYRGLGRKQLREFALPSAQAQDALSVHQAMLGAIANIIAHDRPVNDCKAHLTKWVARLLVVGFLAVATEALTIGLDQI
jgi:hypothetical protein